MTKTTNTEERASTAKQIARSSQEESLTIDDYAVCYRVETGLDPDDILADHRDALLGHPELQRMRIGSTTYTLLQHSIDLAQAIEGRLDEIIDEDAELVLGFVNGETHYCPDRRDLVGALSQYGLVFRKCQRKHTWREMFYGGLEWEKFFDRDELGQWAQWKIKSLERAADGLDRVRKIQLTRFAGSPIVFMTWTDTRGYRYIAYARVDWGRVKPLEYAA